MKYEDLKILDELREKGSITEEEYQREKEKILNSDRRAYNSGRKPLLGLSENSYLMLMHLSQFAGLLLPLAGFVVPIIMWIINKDNSLNVDLHGKNIVNCMISYTLYAIVLSVTVVGIPIAILLGVLYVIFVIMASVRANNGVFWKYPLIIQFIK